MSVVHANIEMDSELEAQAQALFSELGLSMSTAVNLFLRQAVRTRAIPFPVRADEIPNEETREAIAQVQRLKRDPDKKTYRSFGEILEELEEEEGGVKAV